MSRVRGWVFTKNNYDDGDIDQVYALQAETCVQYAVVGMEVGESGTPHLQGYLYFKEKKSLAQVCGYFPGCHAEERRGTHKEASDYCKKDGVFFECGKLPADDCGAAGKEAMAALMQRTMECVRDGDYKSIPFEATHFIKAAEYRVLKEEQQERNLDTIEVPLDQVNFWYYGAAGTGKSRKAREDNPGAYLKMCNKWWDGYRGEDVVLIEDFDKAHSVLCHHLKIWADRFNFNAEIKGGSLRIRPKSIIVTSNYHPRDIWTDVDGDLNPILRRFKVVHFLGNVGEHVVVPMDI